MSKKPDGQTCDKDKEHYRWVPVLGESMTVLDHMSVLEHMPILKHMPVLEHIMSILEHGMPALDQKNSVTEGKNAKIA